VKFEINERLRLIDGYHLYSNIAPTGGLVNRLYDENSRNIFTVIELIKPHEKYPSHYVCMKIANRKGSIGYVFSHQCLPAETPKCEMCNLIMKTFDFWNTIYFKCDACGFS